METTFRQHGPRRLILIFFLIMMTALAFVSKRLIKDTHILQENIMTISENQKGLQKSFEEFQNQAEKDMIDLQNSIKKQGTLISELEKMTFKNLDK